MPGCHEMTLKDLYDTPWNCMTDYPKIQYPWRAPVLAQTQFNNEHEIALEARVLTNRSRNRFWIEIVYVNGGGFGNLRLYRTTTSRRKVDSWISALLGGFIGGHSRPSGSRIP